MPKLNDIHKVLVIGSGPIIIGQAAEFDYAGTQACRAFKEEGLRVILANSNPATIMTDTCLADRVYVEPINVDFLEKIIRKEQPDSLLATVGGQVGLNMVTELEEKGILSDFQIKVLGTSVEAIRRSENRECFKQIMKKIGQPVPQSVGVTDINGALRFARKMGYPLIIRPAYTLGGGGGGIAYNEKELVRGITRGLARSPIGQCLLECSVVGWKEIEFEVIRDGDDNCMIVCSMENVDPMGIHTGDSVVVAPVQTLSTSRLKMLRQAAVDVVRALHVVGSCNVQLAIHPTTDDYYVIEANPRVSRSSALASKATGYPIAKVASKVALGYRLDEISYPTAGNAHAFFEPAVDYIAVKLPRWPFDKFKTADCTIGIQMKSTGEVMALEHSFESALLKAVRCLEIGTVHLQYPEFKSKTENEIRTAIATLNSERLFAIAEGFRRGLTVEQIHQDTRIDVWFLNKIHNIIVLERELVNSTLNVELLRKAKRNQFADHTIAKLTNHTEEEIRLLRKKNGISPIYRKVNNLPMTSKHPAGYYYSTYEQTISDCIISHKKKIVVLGAGPIRIGQGVEFDYCSVQAVWALKEMGYETLIINNNPETVSTDFDISDRLYFEPLTTEDVLNILDQEKPEGVFVQFGGQTAINLAASLARAHVKILGTSVEDIDRAENRLRLNKLLVDCHIPCPQGDICFTAHQALETVRKIGYPVILRPSYVLGGRAMEIMVRQEGLIQYMTDAVRVNQKYPVFIDRYISGLEVEVDAICDGRDVFLVGIMEHIEKTGIHSGDSVVIYPAPHLNTQTRAKIIEYTTQIALNLHIKGIFNVQYVVCHGQVYVIEVNPRASRTVPFLSKATHIPLVKVSVKCIAGISIKEQGYKNGLQEAPDYYAVKVPVFSFNKMDHVDTLLGPEMKSTGEVMACGYQYNQALYKAFLAAGINLPKKGKVFISVADADKPQAVWVAKGFIKLGYTICASKATADYLKKQKIAVSAIPDTVQGERNLIDDIRAGQIALIINTLEYTPNTSQTGFAIRRACTEQSVTCLSSLDTAHSLQKVLYAARGKMPNILALQDLQ